MDLKKCKAPGQCAPYNENIAAQDGPTMETAKFTNSKIFQKLRSDVSKKLGFVEPTFQPLSAVTILNIYEMCRFEVAWNIHKNSPWCSVSLTSTFQMLN